MRPTGRQLGGRDLSSTLTCLYLEHHGQIVQLLLVVLVGIEIVLNVEVVLTLLDVDALEVAEYLFEKTLLCFKRGRIVL